MKYISYLNNIEEINDYNLDGLIIAHDKTSYKTNSKFNLKEIEYFLNKYQKEIFIQANRILKNKELKDLSDLYNLLSKYKTKIKGIIVGDLGSINLSYKYNLNDLIIYNPDTLITNIYDFNFFSTLKIKGAVISKEIDLENVLKINEEKELETFYIGLGYLSMFYSPRKMISNYFEYINKEVIKKDLFIKEETRNYYYPIYEDEYGVYVFRDKIFTIINYLDKFQNFDYIIIDNIFIKDDELIKILSAYKTQKDLNYLNENYGNKFDEGFLNKKTIYKVEV